MRTQKTATFIVLLLLSSCAYALESEEPTRCRLDERTFFSCKIKGKTLSICASPVDQPFEALEYRFGLASKNELTYTATRANKNRFHAYVEPVSPGALVSQVWFDRGAFRYLVSQCVGGNCPKKGGLIVYKNNKPILSAACEGGFHEHAWFDPKVIDFGSDFAESSSKTELVILEEIANDIESLYTAPVQK